MSEITIQDIDGHTFQVHENILTCREASGDLGFFVPVESIRRFRLVNRGVGHGLGFDFGDENGTSTPESDSWRVYDFATDSLVSELIAAIQDERAQSGATSVGVEDMRDDGGAQS